MIAHLEVAVGLKSPVKRTTQLLYGCALPSYGYDHDHKQLLYWPLLKRILNIS